MKNKIIKKTSSLLWKYNNLLSEIISQKELFSNETMFLLTWCKYAAIVNKLQGNLIKYA